MISRRAMPIFKIKSLNKRIFKERMNFAFELSIFANQLNNKKIVFTEVVILVKI